MTEPTPTPDAAASVAAVVRAAAMNQGEMYPCRLGVFCDRCLDTFESDFIVSTEMTPAERLGVVRKHVVKQLGWTCDQRGDYCPNCIPEKLAPEVLRLAAAEARQRGHDLQADWFETAADDHAGERGCAAEEGTQCTAERAALRTLASYGVEVPR
ncbi:hypothetical protein [Actinophytocola sp.]|uniref:hypothetical protein n=1 Tax=Actinophytocola sp. TaxID=1872138 RepID=UPI002D7F3CC9|nr:hypothetical protein [Actinophytocola sp.]HET9144113.1 hypothetical protein [Actinophytocola sp.]